MNTITTLNPARLLQWKPDQPETAVESHGYTISSRAMAMNVWEVARREGLTSHEIVAACAMILSSVRTLCELSVPEILRITREKLERMERLGLIRLNLEISES